MLDTTLAAPPTTPKPAAPNKRRSRRQTPRTSTRLRVYRNALGVGPNIALSLLDLSETGARMTLREALKVGQEVEFVLESVGGCRHVKALARVVWVVPAADGTFVLGAHFLKALSYADTQALAR